MVNRMKPEKTNQSLIRWLLIATIVLLALVLGLQLWQIFGSRSAEPAGVPAAPQTAGAGEPSSPAAVSPGKAAMIEDVRTLNADLSAGDLARLSAEELEQLYETGAPGLPIGLSAAAQAAEEYAGTLAVDSITSETDPELDESPAHYEVELRHPALGDFEYKIDAYTGAVLEGTPDILGTAQSAAASQTPAPVTQQPAAQQPAAQEPAPSGGETPDGLIGEEAAKNAAFAHAGIAAADAGAVRCELDWEDGRQIYEIEFWAGSTEYDYEIDASTGAVLKAELDR